MIPGIGSMGGAELLILLVILFFGMREFRREAARSGDEDGKEIAANAGKGGGSV
jgi:hypothetical protein